MRFLLLITLLVYTAPGHTQNLSYNDGRPVLAKTVVGAQGEELLYADWRKGNVVTADGKTYKDVVLLYNLLNDQLFFQGIDGQSMLFVTPVREFVINDSITGIWRMFRKGGTTVTPSEGDPFYEVLADGRMQLLKRNKKKISEVTEYNSVGAKKLIVDEVFYYLLTNGTLQNVKRDKESLKKALPDLSLKIDEYASVHKPNLKKEASFIEMIKFLNNL